MAEQSIFFYKDFEEYDTQSAKKYLQPIILEPLRALYCELKNRNNWDNENISNSINNCAKKFNIKMGKLAQPLRVAITGTAISPSIDDTLRLLGQGKSLDRLKNAIQFIENYHSS